MNTRKRNYITKIIKARNFKNISLERCVYMLRKILWVSDEELDECFDALYKEIEQTVSNPDNALLKSIKNILITKHVTKEIWKKIWLLKGRDLRNFKNLLIYLIQYEDRIDMERQLKYIKLIKKSTWMNIESNYKSYLYNSVPIESQRRIKKHDTCIIFDIEFDMQGNREQIIEIAALKIKNNRIVGRFSKLIKNKFPLSAKFKEITGIQTYFLRYKKNDKQILEEFFNFIDGSDVIIGFAILQNDIPMLKRFDILKNINMFDVSKYYFFDLQNYLATIDNNGIRSLNYFYESMNLDVDISNLHRAEDDVIIMNEIFSSLDINELIIKKNKM